ncbi:MAG: oligosaccharide flippase family protein [Bacteroidota bacterium]
MKFIKKRLDKQSKTLIKNSSWIFLSNSLGTALGFVRSVVIARCLGVHLFGIYSLTIAFVALVIEYLNLNMGSAVIRFGAIYKFENRIDKFTALLKATIKINLLMALITVAIVSVFSFQFYADVYKTPGLEWFTILFAAASTSRYFNSVSMGMLRMFYKFKLNAIITIIMDLIETVIIVLALIFYPRNLGVFFSAVIVTRFLNGMICNFMAFYEIKKDLLPYRFAPYSVIKPDVKQLREFVISTSISGSLKTTIAQGDTVLLGSLISATAVGFYSVAKKLGYAVFVLTDPLSSSIYPQLSKLLAEKRYPEVKKMLRKITTLSLFPAIILLTVLFFLKDWIVISLYGKSFAESAMPFFFFLVSAVLGAMTFWTLPLIQSLGLASMRLKIYIVTIITGIAFAFWLVPLFQSTGMAIAALITNVLNMVLFIWFSFRKIRTEELKSALEINPAG